MFLGEKFIIAHRGASGLVEHENTLEAFVKAIEIGTRAMEFDVRKTKDNIMVSYHDEYIAKNHKISNLTYAELQDIAAREGFSVPTVEDILQISRDKIILDIELKEAGYEGRLIRLVKSYLNYDQFFMKSFYDDIIIRIKKFDPQIKTGLLLGLDSKKFFSLIERIKNTAPDFIAPHYALLSFGFTSLMSILKLPMYVWTVNDRNLMKKLFQQGVTAIITDYPDVGLEVLDEFTDV